MRNVECTRAWPLYRLHSGRSSPIPSTMFSRFPLAVVVSLPALCLLAQPAIPTQLELFNRDGPTSTTCQTITGDIEHTIIHGCACVSCHLPSLSRLLMDVGHRVIGPGRTTTHSQTTGETDGNSLPTTPLLPTDPRHHGPTRSHRTIPIHPFSAPTAPPITDQQSTSSASGVDGSSNQSKDSRSVIQMPSPSTSSGGTLNSHPSISRSRITAAVLGSILGVAIIASSIFLIRRRRRRRDVTLTPRPLLSEKHMPAESRVRRVDYPVPTARIENGGVENTRIPMGDASIRRLFQDREFESQLLQFIQRRMDRTRRVSSSGSLPPAYDAT